MVTSEEVFEVTIGDFELAGGSSATIAVYWDDSDARFCAWVPESRHTHHAHRLAYSDHYVLRRSDRLEFGQRVTNLGSETAHFGLHVLWTV